MMQSIFLSVVIPAYNEEATIEKVVCDHLEVLGSVSHLVGDWEMICLDDSSSDHTFEVLSQLRERIAKLRVIHHEKNQGIYESFTHLFMEARGTHIYLTAADDQWPAENLKRLVSALVSRKCDLVIGVRTNRREIYGVWRRVLSFVFNLIPRVLFGIETMDANGIKLGVADIFKFKLMSRSFFGEIERIVEAKKKGYQITFEPIQFLPRGGGKATGAKWKNISAVLYDCMRYIGTHGISVRAFSETKTPSKI